MDSFLTACFFVGYFVSLSVSARGESFFFRCTADCCSLALLFGLRNNEATSFIQFRRSRRQGRRTGKERQRQRAEGQRPEDLAG